jgi:hypothetical protein
MEIKLQVDLATYDPKSPQDFRDTWDPEFTADLATLLEFPDDSRIEVYKFEPQFTKTKTKTKGPVLVGFKIANEGQDTPLPGADLVEKFESIKAGDAQGTLLTTASVTSYTLITDTKNAPSSPSSGMSSTAVIAIVCVVIGCVLAIAGYFYWRSHKRGSKTQFKSDVATISSAPAATMTSTDGWSKVWDENTKHYYYFNSKTSESRWTPPPGVTF